MPESGVCPPPGPPQHRVERFQQVHDRLFDRRQLVQLGGLRLNRRGALPDDAALGTGMKEGVEVSFERRTGYLQTMA